MGFKTVPGRPFPTQQKHKKRDGVHCDRLWGQRRRFKGQRSGLWDRLHRRRGQRAVASGASTSPQGQLSRRASLGNLKRETSSVAKLQATSNVGALGATLNVEELRAAGSVGGLGALGSGR